MTESRPTLALCMIVRNVAPYITDCLSSIIAHVDELCIVDTGSDDDTLAVIDDIVNMRRGYERPFRYEKKTFDWTTNPESFFKDEAASFDGIDVIPDMPFSGTMVLSDYGKARQTSFDMAESDYIMWIDSDDVVAGAPNLDVIVEKMRRDNVDSNLFYYDYEEDNQGRVVNKLLRTRIIRRGSLARWENPIHEAIGPLGKLELIEETVIKIVHKAKNLTKVQPHRIPFRNYKVLMWRWNYMLKNGIDVPPRMYFYLGNETRPYQIDKAIGHLTKYISVSEWSEEKALALIYIGQSFEAQGDMLEAESYYATAMGTFPKPEASFGLARIAFFRKDWRACIHFHEMGRKALHEVRDVLHCNPLDRYYYPAIAAGAAYLALGDVVKATKIVDEGLTYAPNDLQLQGVKQSVTKIARRRHRFLDVVIHNGRSLENWNASTPRTTGLGGSETATVLMSEALARRGHRVKVYCSCEGMEGTSSGVEYINYDKFKDHKGNIDVFISSRRPVTFNEEKIDARVKILWVHDAHMGLGAHELSRGILQADALFCLSDWHKANILDHYPYIHPDKIVVTRNGIDSSLFLPQLASVEKTKNKLIYSSSFDRGLDTAIKLMPEIRKVVPDAELHVFYGFDTAIAMVERMRSERGIDKPALVEKMNEVKALAEATEGVFLRGRMNQVDLAKEFLDSKAWFYPTTFTETSCCHPDTMISLPGNHIGGPPRIRIVDLVGKSNFPVYAYDHNERRFKLGTVLWVAQTKIAEEMLAIELDDGSFLRVTPEHLVMNFDREWKRADELKTGDRLTALHYRYNVSIKDVDGTWEPESRLVGEWMKGKPLESSEHVNHIDPMRLNNNVDMLEILTASEHARKTHTGKKQHVSKEAAKSRDEKFKIWLRENIGEVTRRNRANGRKLWETVRAMTEGERSAWLKNRTARKMETMRKIREEKNQNATHTTVRPHKHASGLRLWNFVNSMPENERNEWLKNRSKRNEKTVEAPQNHRIISIKRIPGGPVYDMEVKDLHNFVADGVVVHNCISAMEAQAAACIPITTELAALKETVHHGFMLKPKLVDGKWTLPDDVLKAFVKRAIWCLTDDVNRDKLAQNARKNSLDFHSWDTIAREWEIIICNQLLG